MNIGIIGSGEWGKALATLVARAGHKPRIAYRSTPPGGFAGTPNTRVLTQESDLLIFAVPAESLQAAVAAAGLEAGSRVVLATRGLQQNGERLSDLIVDHTPCRRVGSLAGPALAAEVIRGRPTGLVIASPFDEVCKITQEALHSEVCRIYSSNDLLGVELAGAMVLVLSVAIGIGEGMDLGISGRGILITRGIAEAARLGEALGAHPATFSGLAGIGDLVSCGSHEDHLSFKSGLRVARGATCPMSIQYDVSAVLEVAKRHNVDMPLTQAIQAIVAGHISAKLAMDQLMRREARPE
jgi:glycerol-3-phosphate dehydrogenase (NAD(P)+)